MMRDERDVNEIKIMIKNDSLITKTKCKKIWHKIDKILKKT